MGKVSLKALGLALKKIAVVAKEYIDLNAITGIDSQNANGLSKSANGLQMAMATKSTNGAGGSAGAMSALDKENLDKVDLGLISDAEIASWFGYDITGTPNGDAATVKTVIESVGSDSITDEQ